MYRVIARRPDGRRAFYRLKTEDAARERAREIEAAVVFSGSTPDRAGAPREVGHLIDRYVASLGSRSVRYRERQEYLLRMWVVPVLGTIPLTKWTPAKSEEVLDRARSSLAPSTVQNIGSAMRSLVTFAQKNRWLSREADPMWTVRYSPIPEHQGEALGFIPRSVLPSDDQCRALFDALEAAGQPQWALAMRLKHRCGARWGELVALRPCDIDLVPQRIVRIGRAVEQSRQGFAIKSTKNRQHRTTVFPLSLVDELQAHCRDVARRGGSEALLFTADDGGFANRRTFQRTWSRAARDADWPMRSPTSARWHPHDLRHVAACWMLFDVGLDPAVASMLLGHANAAFTLSRYVGVRGDIATLTTSATEAW
jgi:integrase